MVVDDSHESLRLLVSILTKEGYRVLPADGGELALKSMESTTPDLILLDIRMPGIDGFEVLKRLRATGKCQRTPVIFLSGVTDVEQRTTGLRLGAVDFITKPFQQEELLARVWTHMELFQLRMKIEKQSEDLGNANEILKNERDKLELATRNLNLANKKLSILSSITRHDALNQLMVIRGYSDLLAKSDLDSEKADYVKRVIKSVEEIQRQLDFTKQYENIGTNDPIWHSLHENVGRVASHLELGGLVVKTQGSDISVLVDPMFEKVVYNLIENAIRHGGGAKTVCITTIQSDEEMKVIFEDDGAGISLDDKSNLFKRGFGKNTGFGLFLSREILEMTGITIAEKSEPGRGARFVITVPKNAWRPNQIAT
jgi:DNA-binding response OmpR family regulator